MPFPFLFIINLCVFVFVFRYVHGYTHISMRMPCLSPSRRSSSVPWFTYVPQPHNNNTTTPHSTPFLYYRTGTVGILFAGACSTPFHVVVHTYNHAINHPTTPTQNIHTHNTTNRPPPPPKKNNTHNNRDAFDLRLLRAARHRAHHREPLRLPLRCVPLSPFVLAFTK